MVISTMHIYCLVGVVAVLNLVGMLCKGVVVIVDVNFVGISKSSACNHTSPSNPIVRFNVCIDADLLEPVIEIVMLGRMTSISVVCVVKALHSLYSVGYQSKVLCVCNLHGSAKKVIVVKLVVNGVVLSVGSRSWCCVVVVRGGAARTWLVFDTLSNQDVECLDVSPTVPWRRWIICSAAPMGCLTL